MREKTKILVVAALIVMSFCMVGVFVRTVRKQYTNNKEITVQPQDISCDSQIIENLEDRARYLGLSCKEFNILVTSVREYLYDVYPFTRQTEFGIRYERVETKIKSVPSEAVTIDAYANFRTPPVVVTVVLYGKRVWFLSEETASRWEL